MDNIFEICTGGGNGMFTLRRFDGYYHTGEPRFAHVKNLSRDPHEALRKAQDHIRAEGEDVCSALEDFDPNNVSSLNAWGECDPMRQAALDLIDKGTMTRGKYFGQAISDIPIEYFVRWYLDGDIDTKRSDTIKEHVRLQVLPRRDEFMAVVEADKVAQAQREAELEAKRSKSIHVGEVGQRIVIETTITFSKGFEGFYGTTFINSLEDADGNVFIYRGNKLGDAGELVCLKATIKEHSEYNGVKQTIINRPKVKGE